MSAKQVAYWLLKTEPTTYSYQDLQSEGTAVWDGVRNAVALKNLSAFRKGDRAFIYHTGDEKAVVAIAVVTSDGHRDNRAGHDPLPVVEVAFERKLPNAVTLKRIKADSEFRDFPLVRLPRLSVMPVSPAEWDRINEMSKSPG